jgi:hypothetical protein
VDEPNSNAEIAVDLSVYLMWFVGHLSEEQVQDVNGFVDVIVAEVGVPLDLNESEIGLDQGVICGSAVIDLNDLDSVDLDDLHVVEVEFGHLANAGWALPNWLDVDNSADLIGYVHKLHVEVVGLTDVA